MPSKDTSVELSNKDKENLLKLARQTLAHRLTRGKDPSPKELGIEVTPSMQTVMGAFVSLHNKGQLRGCVGEIVPRRPLYQVVMDQAINSGLNDNRFTSVSESELDQLDFEISALTPPQPVDSYNDIVIGRHGVVLQKNGKSAVFLPQVAPEHGWNLEQMLSHLAHKAGLPPEAWKEGTTFEVFEAIVFAEQAG